jgi:hypothetical protein
MVFGKIVEAFLIRETSYSLPLAGLLTGSVSAQNGRSRSRERNKLVCVHNPNTGGNSGIQPLEIINNDSITVRDSCTLTFGLPTVLAHPTSVPAAARKYCRTLSSTDRGPEPQLELPAWYSMNRVLTRSAKAFCRPSLLYTTIAVQARNIRHNLCLAAAQPLSKSGLIAPTTSSAARACAKEWKTAPHS